MRSVSSRWERCDSEALGATLGSVTEHHHLGVTSGVSGLVYECEDGCSRCLVVDRTTGEMTVIDHGDRAALHHGSIGEVTLRPVAVSPLDG
jgi:hypothetical protein